MIVNRSVPSASVIPVLAYPDVGEAVDRLCRAFGFTERLRIGAHRAQLVFGDGALIVTGLPGTAGATPDAVPRHSLHVRVADVDSAAWGAIVRTTA